MAQKHEAVVFLDSAGNEITNDPIMKAQLLLKEAGVDQPDATLASSRGPAEDEGDDDFDVDGEENDDADSGNEGDDLDQLNGAELKKLAKERGVDISGLKKVSQVRQALRDAQE